MRLGRAQINDIPDDICEVLSLDLLSEAPDLPNLLKELRKAVFALQRKEEELEGFAQNRAKSSVGVQLKFVSRTSGKGDYLDRLGVGRKQVSVYRNGRWEAVKDAELEGFLLQFWDSKQFKRWLFSYKLRLLLLYIYFLLGRILERLGIVELVKVS